MKANTFLRKRLSLLAASLFILLTAAAFMAPAPAQAAAKISRSAITVATGKKTTLKVTGTSKKVTWKSSSKKIATVTSHGVVKGVKKGTATITAKVGSKTLKCKVTVSAKKGTNVKKTASAVSKVTMTSYTYPDGYFKMKIPKGWKVKVEVKGFTDYSLIYYGISVYDPKHKDREFYLCLMTPAGHATQASKNAWSWYPSHFNSQLPLLSEVSTKGYFETCAKFYGLSDFKVQQNLGKSAFDGDVLIATAKSTASKKTVKGIFTATIDATGALANLPANAHIVIMEKAPENEFLDWQPTLDKCFSSLTFTQKFINARNQKWEAEMNAVNQGVQNGREMSDMIMDSYKKRSTSSDVASQKRSDATLGYERVYDTQTGSYYRADNGFGDYYTGSRYKTVTSSKAYLAPVSGYITWK